MTFATETPEWRLIVYPDGTDQWQMIVEPVHGDLRASCESVWRSIQRGGRSLSPRLERLEIYDGTWTQALLRARVGLVPQLKGRDLWIPLIVGVVSAIVLAVSGADTGTVLGAIPGIAAAFASMVVIISDALRKKLVWSP